MVCVGDFFFKILSLILLLSVIHLISKSRYIYSVIWLDVMNTAYSSFASFAFCFNSYFFIQCSVLSTHAQ